MKVDVKTYKIVCDCCGRTFISANDEVCYVDYPDGITDMCRDSDWLITADDHHYCPYCHQLDDCDCWETKDGKLYAYDGEPINNGLVKGI